MCDEVSSLRFEFFYMSCLLNLLLLSLQVVGHYEFASCCLLLFGVSYFV
jgi:hypothetical protein